MADSRTIPVAGVQEWLIPRFSPLDKPTPPPWYAGTELFGFGTNPNLAEPLKDTPLAYTFSSPFVDGDVRDSYFTYTKTTRDVRNMSLSRDLAEIQAYPPSAFWQARLPFGNRPTNGYLSKLSFGFCVGVLDTYVGLDTSEYAQPRVLGLDVPSGNKTLTKQDFCLQYRPKWNSNEGLVTPSLGGFSLQEVDSVGLTDAEHYNLVRKRVVCICSDIQPENQLPRVPNDGAGYLVAIDPALQFNVSAGGNYWRYFHTTRYSYPDTQGTSFFKYFTNGGYTVTLLFVGEFSLKQLHDYITETNYLIRMESNAISPNNYTRVLDPMHYAFIFTSGNADSDANMTSIYYANQKRLDWSLGMKYSTPSLDLVPTFEDQQAVFFNFRPRADPTYSTDPKDVSTTYESIFKFYFKEIDIDPYVKGCYYYQIQDFKHPKMVTGGQPVIPINTKDGIFDWSYIGTGKIEAYTFNGASPTPYKPVYLLERTTGRMIRESVSDKNGKYVIHAVPTGVEYIAVSVDPTHTMNSAVEEFGAIE